MARIVTLLLILTLFNLPTFAQIGCSYYNTRNGPTLYSGYTGTKEHVNGFHTWGADFSTGCTYADAPPGSPCPISAFANAAPYTLSEQGTLTTVLDVHDGNDTFQNGTHDSTGSAVSADAEGAASFRSCWPSCGVSITISGTGEGTGFNVTFPSDNIYADSHRAAVTCDAKTAPGCAFQTCPGREVWNYQTCSCQYVSPIVVDTNGGGFHFTDPKTSCVNFNWGDQTVCTSWPQHGSGNAWLVYDRDGDGKIDSADELFGNFTPHSDGDYLPANLPRPNPTNGFMALAYYDQPANGGNQDMQIDARDKIWPKLKLWIDDHCYKSTAPCSALPGELHRPEEFGIHGFSIMYGPNDNPKTEYDQWGNWFRLFAQANPKPHDFMRPSDELREMRVYDVFLARP